MQHCSWVTAIRSPALSATWRLCLWSHCSKHEHQTLFKDNNCYLLIVSSQNIDIYQTRSGITPLQLWLLAVVYTAAAAGFLPLPVSTSPPPPPRPPSSTDGNSLQHHHAAEANYPVTLPHCSAHCHVTRVPVTAVSRVSAPRRGPPGTGAGHCGILT